MQLKRKKIGILGTIIVYCASFLLQSNLVFFQTWAQEKNMPRVNIIAVLVDDHIYNSISGRLQRYTTKYVQRQIPDSKALVMPLDLTNISAYDIHRMMENIYFDGLENVNSSLVGLIMVGDIPLPVVNQDGYVFPTVYPYVDFEDQKYVWDSESQYFVPNGNVGGQAEIWHGLINYGNEVGAYVKFFDKVEKYFENPNDFIGDSMWYEDIIASKEGFLNENFKYYRNKIIFGEDIGYQRYSPLMKKLFASESSSDSADITQDFMDTMGELGGDGDIDMGDVMAALESGGGDIPSTQMVQQQIEDSFLADYNELFAKNVLSTMRENVFAGGRWIKTYENASGDKSQIVDSDSSASMIQLKDTMYLGNERLQGLIENLNELMEKMIDKKIEDEKYSMDIVIPLSYKKITGKRIDFKCHSLVERWENYYFGKNARYINEAKELSIYRGTYRNLDTIDGLTYDDLLSGDNPIKSKEEKTNLKLKSIGASYDIFSTQVEGNRGFLMTEVEADLDTYDINRTNQTGSVGFWETLSLSSVKRRKWPEKCKESKCEQVNPFAQRWRGGASPINLITESISKGRYEISGYIADSSWRSIFDMGGFQSLLPGEDEGMNGTGWINGLGTGPQTAATSFKSYIKYSSPTQREGWEIKWGLSTIIIPLPFPHPMPVYKPNYYIFENHTPDVHTGFNYLNYWDLKTTYEGNIAFTKGRFSKSNDKLNIDYAEPDRILKCESAWSYSYKIISSVIKHDSTTQDEINGVVYEKYGENGTLGSYYRDLRQAYGDIESDLSEILTGYPSLISEIQKNNAYISGYIGSLYTQGYDLRDTQNDRANKEKQKSDAESSLRAAERKLGEKESELSDLRDELAGLRSDLSAAGDDDDTSDIEAQIDSLEDDISSVEREISSLESRIRSLNGTISSLTSGINADRNHESNVEVEISKLLDAMPSIISGENAEIVRLYKLTEGLFPENVVSVLEYIIGSEGGNPMDYYETSDASALMKVGFLSSWISDINKTHSKVLEDGEKVVDDYAKMYLGMMEQKNSWDKLAKELKSITKENISKIDDVSLEMSGVLTVYEEPSYVEIGSASLDDDKPYLDSGGDPVTLTGGSARNAIDTFGVGLSNAKDYFNKLIVPDLTGAEIIVQANVNSDFNNWLTKKGIDKSSFSIEDLITQFAVRGFGDGQDSDWVRANQEKLEGVVIHMPGLALLTPSRPIDSPRYVSMQSIAGNEIKLIYPDLFKVEVFTGKKKGLYDVHQLLTGGQIKEKLIEYLSGKVVEYNTILMNEYENALTEDDYFKALFTNSFQLATPTKVKSYRPYNPFTLEEFIDALGGTGMIDAISDILYYQSITNKKKLGAGDVSEDISKIKDSFNINDKRELTLKDYLIEGNEKIKNPLFVIPNYELSGYEVAYINSNGKDYIIPASEKSDTLNTQEASFAFKVRNKKGSNNNQTPQDGEMKDECNIPDSGVLPLFKLEGLKVTSPWANGFWCWLQHLPNSVKVKLKFDSSLGEIFTSSGFEDYIKKTDIGQSLVNWGESMVQYADDLNSVINPGTGFNYDMRNTQLGVNAEKHNNDVINGSSEVGNAMLNLSRNLKISNSNSNLSSYQYNGSNPFSELRIESDVDVGRVRVEFLGTGDGCLEFNKHNLCDGYSFSLDPKRNPFTGLISSYDHKAGAAALDIKVYLGGEYIEKVIKYAINPGELDHVEINVESKPTFAGMMTPVEVVGYDLYGNRLTWTIERYKFTASKGQFLKDGAYNKEFVTNDFRNLKFYYQAPSDAHDGDEAIIQILKIGNANNGDEIIETYPQPLAWATPEISIDNVVVLSNGQLVASYSLQLLDDEKAYNIYEGGSLNLSKLHTIDIYMKDAKGNIVDIDSQVVITPQQGLLIPGQLQKGEDGEDVFFETYKNYISGGHVTIYYYPTTVAGDEKINIDIPGLDMHVINYSILPGIWKYTQIIPSKDVINVGEIVEGSEVFLYDIWGNSLKGNMHHTYCIMDQDLKIAYFVNPDGSIISEDNCVSVGIKDGYGKTPHILGTGGGLVDMLDTTDVSWVTITRGTVQLNVDKNIFPHEFEESSGLNILYLNYFGNDWGNQRGYFSDNNKYIENLMKHSNKIITTTTQLISEEKIKKMVRKIQPGFQIWTPDSLNVSMILKNNRINMIIDSITDMNSSLPSFNYIQATQDTIENILNSKTKVSQNTIFFMPSDVNCSLEGGILYNSGEIVANILNGDVTLQLTDYTLSNGDNIWNITYKGKSYGNIVIHYPSFFPKLSDFGIPGYRYAVNPTFTNGSTYKQSSIGVFDLQTDFELESSYKSIQNSDDVDEKIGFLGDFKNITLFAEGEIVGEATKRFGSEFVINLGDPILSRKSANNNVGKTEFDGGIGQEIYSDSEDQIFGTYQIDFNSDGLKDLLVVYLDGTVKLSKNYGGTTDFRDMQELMRIAVGIKELYIGDVDGKGGEDIIILTNNNQLRAYLNHGGIFDVDGNVGCFNLNVHNGEVSSSPSDLSDVYNVFVEDMNMDKITDVVTYDHKGYIKIFYGGSTNGGPNYLSKETYACDTGWYLREISNTQIVDAFGLKVSNEPIFDNSMLYWVGIEKKPVEITKDELHDYGIDFDPDTLEDKITKKDRDNDGSIELVVHEIMDKVDISTGTKTLMDKVTKFQDVTLYDTKLVGGNGRTYTFVPLSYLNGEDAGIAWKIYSVKSGSTILGDGDIVTVTVTIQANEPFLGSFGDVIQGPWKLYYDKDNVFKGIKFIQNKRNAVVKRKDGGFAYIIDNISLGAGETMIYQYDLEYRGVKLKNIDLTYDTRWSPSYTPDIKAQSVNGCDKNFIAYLGDSGFGRTTIKLEDEIENVYISEDSNTNDYAQDTIGYGSDIKKIPGIVQDSINRISLLGGDSLEIGDDAEGKKTLKNTLLQKISEGGLESLNINLNLDLSILDEQSAEIEKVIDDVTKGMCNGFQFGGSSNCPGLPVPFNQAFLAPGKYHLFGCWELPLEPLEGGLPVFFFPGTLTTPVGTYPIPWGQKFEAGEGGDKFLWAGGGVYPSFIRIYAAPTLTAQLGIAICIGHYATSHLFPSPLGDVAGNCVVFAVKPQCKKDGKSSGEEEVQTYTPIVEDVRDSGTCSKVYKGPIVTELGFRGSAFDEYSYGSSFSDLKLYPNDIDQLLKDLQKMYGTPDGVLTADEEKKYGTIWNKIWEEYLEQPAKMSVDMAALGINVVTLGLFRHVMGKEQVDKLYGNIDNLYAKYFDENKLTPAVDLGYGYTSYSASYMGIIDLEMDSYIGEDDYQNTKNSIMVGDVDILGGTYSVNKIRGGLQQGIRKMIIDKWLDPQIRYIANQLTKMHINVKLPDLSKVVDNEVQTIKDVSSKIGDIFTGTTQTDVVMESVVNLSGEKSEWEWVSSQTLDEFSKDLANPFEALATLMNKSNIINISMEPVTVKVPWIFAEDINAYSVYLSQWVSTNEVIIGKWENVLSTFSGSCADEPTPAQQQACYDKAASYWSSFVEFQQDDRPRMLEKIYMNLRILQEYRDFPFEVYEWIHVVDRYMSEISSLISNTLGYLSYWVTTNAARYVGYVDAIVLIMNIIKTYQLVIDFSVDWSENCGNCSRDTYDQYSCKLSMLCDKIELPIIQIPNFKIPNITLDLSNIDLGLDIVLPEFNFQTLRIDLPDIPNLPEPPSISTNIKLFNLPDIPILPEPPELPELPSFIPEVELELPLLPPAPELPKLPGTIEATIRIAKIIGKIYCIVKGSFGLVGEKSVKAKIEQITQRTYQVNWIDNIMDYTNWTAAPVNNYGVDYEISSYVDIQFNFTDFYDYLDTLTNSINNLRTNIVNEVQNGINTVGDEFNNAVNDMNDKIEGNYRLTYDVGLDGLNSDEIEYVDYITAKNRLKDVLSYFRKEANSSSFADSMNVSIKKIENQIDTPNSIEPNTGGLAYLEDEVLKYLQNQRSKYDDLANLINDDYEGFLAMVDSNHDENLSNSGQILAFDVQLFNVDSSAKEKIKNISKENPYEMLLENKQNIIDGYWNAINTNSSEDLGLSNSQYLVLRNNIGNMKKLASALYYFAKPASSTSLSVKDGGLSAKTLLASTSRLGGDFDMALSIDPAPFTEGVYEKNGTDGTNLVKVVYSDSFTSHIGKNQRKTEHADEHDIIMWDSDAIYLKCLGQSCSNGGGGYNKYYSHPVKEVPYEETWIAFDKETKLKIGDDDQEVKDWKVVGQTYDLLSFSWTLNGADAYLIKLVDRIDYSYEKVDYTSDKMLERYVLALPYGTDLNTLYNNKVKLELIKKTDLLKTLYGKEVVEVVYYDPNKASSSITISNIDRKWYFGRIATLKFDGSVYTINSPWSNQVVAGKQVLGDDQSPLAEPQLYRPSVSEIVSEGDNLEGYVGTKYVLYINWKDNVALSYINISQSGKILDEKYTSEVEDMVSVDIDIHTDTVTDKYDILGIDQFGNKTEKTISVSYLIPDIKITDVLKNPSGGTVNVIAELSQDIDEGNVSFQRKRGESWKTMDVKSVVAGDTHVLGGSYSIGTDIAMYNNNDSVIALMDPDTAEIKMQTGYEDLFDINVKIQDNTVLQLYNKDTKKIVFSIRVPIKELLKIEAGNYSVSNLPQDGKMGIFNGGKAVYKDGVVVLYIAPTGHLFSELGMEGTYYYDRELQALLFTLYETSDLQKKNPLKVWVKAEPFSAD